MSATIRYCNQCFAYLTPGNIPKSHASHSKDFNAVQNYCFVCRTNIVDGIRNLPHEQHLEREAEQRRKRIKPKQQVTNNNNVWIPLGVGSFLESESIVHKIAKNKIRSSN